MNHLDRLRRYLTQKPDDPDPITFTLRCGAFHPVTRQQCPWPAARLVFTGCVHEHIGPTYVCAGHDEAGFGGEAECHACIVLGHACPLAKIPDPPEDADEWLIQRLQPSGEVDMVEWREFWRENLHRLIPEHLRRAS